MNRYVCTWLSSLQTCVLANGIIIKLIIINNCCIIGHNLPGNLLGDYCDGELYQNFELFQADPCALQIQLYFDEVEVCNPIGSKAKMHKLGI